MAQVTVKKVVNQNVKTVFESWNKDFGNIARFNPNLRASHLLSNSPTSEGLGALRQCDLADGKNWIREKVISVDENKQIVIDIYEGTMPLSEAIATFDFSQHGKDQTEVAMTMKFTPKGGVFGKALIPILKAKFRGMLQALLDANADYVENGTEINSLQKAA